MSQNRIIRLQFTWCIDGYRRCHVIFMTATEFFLKTYCFLTIIYDLFSGSIDAINNTWVGATCIATLVASPCWLWSNCDASSQDVFRIHSLLYVFSLGPVYSWSTSFAWCSKSQRIDLHKEGYCDYFLDEIRPNISVSEWWVYKCPITLQHIWNSFSQALIYIYSMK